MAYNDSGELSPGSAYQLGNYTFELHADQVHEPGEEETVSVYAICRNGGDSRETIAKDFRVGTVIESWSVEANDSEASVYATVKIPQEAEDKKTSPFVPFPIAYGDGTVMGKRHGDDYILEEGGSVGCIVKDYIYDDRINTITASPIPFPNTGSYTYDGKTVYAHATNRPDWYAPYNVPVNEAFQEYNYLHVAWTIVYGTPSYNPEDFDRESLLIGRFAIDLKEAGGGPGGDWDEPGSVEPEPGELTHTLTLTAIAALSGRHNDPLNDTSYSYRPADNTTVKPYGCGGDGGHGGGGGGGASSMVVRQIVTDKASHVEYSTRTKRHGYGSGGGKGGKGGDGCILIFY